MEALKPKASFSRTQLVSVLLLATIQFTVVLDFMILSPLGDILMKSMKITPEQFGTAVSSYAFSAGISGFLAAGYADKFDRKKLLLFFYVGFILGTFFCGIASSYPFLVIARIITGLFGGVIGAISMAIITDLFELNQRGRAMSFVQMAFAASQILGIPIGLKLADIFNWHASFFMIVILAVLTVAAVHFFLPNFNQHLAVQQKQTGLQHLLQAVRKRNYRIGFLATGFLAIGGYMIMPFTSSFLINNVGISNNQLITIFMVTGISSMIVMPLVGKLADSFNKYRIFLYGSVMTSIMVLIYTNLGVTPLWLVMVINVLLFAGIMGRAVPAVALNSGLPDSSDRGAYMSINASLQQIAGGIGAFIAGHIVVQKATHQPLEHFDILGYIMVGIFALCAVLVFRVHKILESRKTMN